MKVHYSIGVGLFVALMLTQTGVASAAVTASLFPTGDGSSQAWTPSIAGTHFTLVDETPCNGVTDYVSASTVGLRDSYQVSLASIPDGAVITKIAMTPCASRNITGTGSSGLGVYYKFNTATSSDSIYTLATGITPTVLATSNFNNLSLTKNASSTLQAGVVYSSGTRGARVSSLATVITYITAAPAAPSNLVATSSTGTSTPMISLTWTNNSTEQQGFSVERGLNGVSFGPIATTSATTYLDSTAATSTLYYYRVRAYNQLGYSAYATATPYSL